MRNEKRERPIVDYAAARRRSCRETVTATDPRIAAVDSWTARMGLAALLAAGAFSLGSVALETLAESSDNPQSVADYAAVLAVSAALLGAGTALAFLLRYGARRSRKAGNLGLGAARRSLASATPSSSGWAFPPSGCCSRLGP
jgi:hypothetical protein